MENEFQIRNLLAKEVFGTLTPDEQEKLNKILATSEEARALRVEVKNNTITAPGEDFYTRDMEADYQEVLRRHRVIKVQRMRNRLLTGFAAICLLASVYWAWPRLPEAISPRSIMPPRNHAMMLEFANGETISMQENGMQSYKIGSTTVYKDSRFLRFHPSEADAYGWNALTIPPRKEQRLLLGDGTEVYLNSASRLRFPFRFQAGGAREVYLDGEAYFIVKEDPARPFIVHAGQADIQTTAGSFNANAYTATNVIASNVSGEATLTAWGKKSRLHPGDQARAATEQPITKTLYDPRYTTTWITGEIYFNEMTVKDFGDLTSRWFNTTLYIDSPEAGGKLVSGKIFRNQPLDDLVEQINQLKTTELYWKNGMLHAK